MTTTNPSKQVWGYWWHVAGKTAVSRCWTNFHPPEVHLLNLPRVSFSSYHPSLTIIYLYLYNIYIYIIRPRLGEDSLTAIPKFWSLICKQFAAYITYNHHVFLAAKVFSKKTPRLSASTFNPELPPDCPWILLRVKPPNLLGLLGLKPDIIICIHLSMCNPYGSMYGIFTYIGIILKLL